MPLLVAFIAVPLIELYFLIQVGEVIGALPTIALCILTAILGAALLRQQGLQTLARARENLDRGEVPAIELFEGVILAIGGVLLLTPGLVTDIIGFACLLPPTRRWLVDRVIRRVRVERGPPPGQGGGRPSGGQGAIEGEYERHDRE